MPKGFEDLGFVPDHEFENLGFSEEQPVQQNLSNPSNIAVRGLADILAGVSQAGQGLRNAPYNITNYIEGKGGLPTGTTEKIASSSLGRRLFAPEKTNLSSAFGVNSPNMIDELIQGASRFAPYGMASAGLGATGILGGAGTGAVYGATQSENPLLGAVEGGAVGGLLGALPKAINSIRPKKISDSLKEMLSEEAVAIKKQPSEELYNKAFEGTANENIYGKEPSSGNKTIDDLIKVIPENKASEYGFKYTDLDPKQVSKIYSGRTLKLLHNKAIENPTLQNMHHLQSELGAKIRKLSAKELANKSLDAGDQVLRDSYKLSRELLKNDIDSFLKKTGKEGADKFYKEASSIYAKDVVPLNNASDLIEAHMSIGDEVNAKTLSKALQKASIKKNLKKMPMPEEVLELGKTLKNRLRNKAIATKVVAPLATAGTLAELFKKFGR